MGSLCSTADTHLGGHTVVSNAATTPVRSPPKPSSPRAAAAEAAERRLKEAQRRGTSLTNPKQGALAAQANKPVKFAPESRKDEPLVWD